MFNQGGKARRELRDSRGGGLRCWPNTPALILICPLNFAYLPCDRRPAAIPC